MSGDASFESVYDCDTFSGACLERNATYMNLLIEKGWSIGNHSIRIASVVVVVVDLQAKTKARETFRTA